MKPILVAALALTAAAVISPASARADTYPSRTITIIVPYPAGGPTDETARVIAHSLADKFKQNVVVENVTGGGTIIATNKVAKAAPDGYTLLVHNLQITANVTLYKNLPFDTEKDLIPVMLINENPLFLVGSNSLAANNLSELIALMKKQPLKAAIPGYGATGHLTTTLLAQVTKASINQIPYRGAAPALTDLLGGHVDLYFATPQQIEPQVKAGKVKAFGITAREKSPEIPAAGSLVAALGPKFDIVYWQALFAPAGTPQPVVAALNDALQATVSDPAIVKRWHEEGMSTFPKDRRSVEAARAMMKSEIARWGETIRDNNIHVSQ